MSDNQTVIIRGGKRDPNCCTEQYLRQMYADLPFDMNLVATNDKKVPVHYFVMMLFSPYLRKKFQTEMVFERDMDGKCLAFNVCISKANCISFLT